MVSVCPVENFYVDTISGEILKISHYRDFTMYCRVSDNKPHRIDGPAKEWGDVYLKCCIVEYWRNGIAHRDDGPAVVYEDGLELWYLYSDNVTDVVLAFFQEEGFNPNWKEWTDSEKVLFKMRFA